MAEPNIPQRTCRDCGITKPLVEFWQMRPDKRGPYCKPCATKRSTESHKRKRKGLAPLRNRNCQRFDESTGIFMRTCAVCRIEKPLDQYSPRNRYCRECRNTRSRKSNITNDQLAKARARYQRCVLKQPAKARTNANARSRKWRAKNPDTVLEYGKQRRARKKGAPIVERISRSTIIKRDNSTCYLCSRKLEPPEITLDHVIPLVRGGHHTADNLRVACRSCNSRKGARMPATPLP